MATKLKNDIWSLAAIVVALFSLLYCFSFILELAMDLPAIDLLASLRTLTKGEA